MFEPRWQALAERLAPVDHTPSQPLTRRHAGVLVALTDQAEPRLLLTRRAAHLSDHPGEIAFPGGKWERTDASLMATALRESEEETGLAPDVARLLGQLPEACTHRGVRVTPLVAVVPPGLALTPEPRELDRLFYAPLGVFDDSHILRWNRFERGGRTYRTPVYHWDGHTVWGLTAVFIRELIRRWPAPEQGRDGRL